LKVKISISLYLITQLTYCKIINTLTADVGTISASAGSTFDKLKIWNDGKHLKTGHVYTYTLNFEKISIGKYTVKKSTSINHFI